MSRRPVIVPNLNSPLVNAHSTAATFSSPATIINQIPGISYDVSWTGTTTGTFSVEVSNTFSLASNGSAGNAGNWQALPATAFMDTLPAPAGSSGHGFIDVIKPTQAYAIRLTFTRSAGTGTMTVLASAKVL